MTRIIVHNHLPKRGKTVDGLHRTLARRGTRARDGETFTNERAGTLGLPVGRFEVISRSPPTKQSGPWGTFSDTKVRNIETGKEYTIPTGNAQVIFGLTFDRRARDGSDLDVINERRLKAGKTPYTPSTWRSMSAAEKAAESTRAKVGAAGFEVD